MDIGLQLIYLSFFQSEVFSSSLIKASLTDASNGILTSSQNTS